MTDAEFPVRTAGELPLPNGDKVWVLTLNTLMRDQADEKARFYAQKECQGLLKGGVDYSAVAAEMRQKTPEMQATYLAQGEFFSIQRDAEAKYPDPMKPEQGDTEAEEFTKKCVEWEKKCAEALAERNKFVEERHQAEVDKAMALGTRARIEKCVQAFFIREFSKIFVERLGIETMFRAVRLLDEHTARYFKSPEAFEDADDAVQKACLDFYYGDLDTVKQAEIPTSPAAS